MKNMHLDLALQEVKQSHLDMRLLSFDVLCATSYLQ